jgi:hypothetical protein
MRANIERMFDLRPTGVPPESVLRSAWQPSLLEPAGLVPGIDVCFGAVRRLTLDDDCWVDHAPAWLHGADVVFERLLACGDWKARDVVMYDRMVAEPRLTARWLGALPDPLDEIREALSARYELAFEAVGVNLYRDGADSVAWHSDRIGAVLTNPLVATISLGAPRRFMLRPKGGGAAITVLPGPGDLLVMGGAVQHRWEHCVPKTRRPVGPRMAITVRHTHERSADGDGSGVRNDQ